MPAKISDNSYRKYNNILMSIFSAVIMIFVFSPHLAYIYSLTSAISHDTNNSDKGIHS